MHSGLGIVPGRGQSGASDEGRAPLQLSRLIGRERELAELESLLASHRLVTLTGTGGTGKTRLAAELALRRDERGDGAVAWVELAACNDGSFLAQRTAAVLSIRESSGGAMTGALIEALRDRDLLLVLDNCEHLVDACAKFAQTLLSSCPRLRIVATTREPLGIPGERLMPIPPLPVTAPGVSDLEVLRKCDAAMLFVDRAASVLGSFSLDASNAAAIADICRRLDGIPLAIELAAARMRHLTAEQISERLEDSFAILSTGSRNSLAHHRTLRAAIDWSFNLLPESEQKLFAKLSVFAGTFSLEAVEAVCADDDLPAEDLLDLLFSLVDKSLVVTVPAGGGTRYHLLETMRQYAAEHLRNGAPIRKRHAEAFLQLARDSAGLLQIASSSRLAALDADHDNFRKALDWSLAEEPDSIALPLASAYRFYWYYRILWAEGFRWMNRALQSTSASLSFDRAAITAAAGAFGAYIGEIERARGLLEESDRMWRQLGDGRQLAYTLSALAQLLGSSGDLAAAEERARESVALARRDGVPYDIAYVLTNASAFIAQLRGDLESADRDLEEAERIWSEHPISLPFVLNGRAVLAMRRGDRIKATEYARRALTVARSYGDSWFSSRSLRILALASADDAPRAARLLGAADALLRAMSTGILLHERDLREQLLAALREALSPEELETALLEGAAMNADEAAALALSESDGGADQSAGTASLEIADLGPLQIALDGKRISGEGRGSARARELLSFLAAHPEGCTREEVAVALWPDASTEQLKNSFHVTLHRLRRMLGRPDAVRLEEGRYSFDPRIELQVHSREFENGVNAALRKALSDSSVTDELRKLIALYRGDYLHGDETGEWCLPIRAHLRRLHLRALFRLGEAEITRGSYADASEAFTQLLSRDPYDEAASRQLMICHSRLGARTESLLVYRRLEQRLREELSSVPQPETASLYQRLQRNEAV